MITSSAKSALTETRVAAWDEYDALPTEVRTPDFLTESGELPETTPQSKLLQSVRPRRRAPLVFCVLAIIAATVSGGVYFRNRGRESTDDAQVEGHVFNIAPRISGQVLSVTVNDNQIVKRGEPLVELDRTDFEVRLSGARADLEAARANLATAEAQLVLATRTAEAGLAQARGGLAQARSTVESSRAALTQARAAVEAAKAQRRLALREVQRARSLFAQNALSRSEIDLREAQTAQTYAALEQAKAHLLGLESAVMGSIGAEEVARGRMTAAETGEQQVAVARAAVSAARARIGQTEAAVRLAELNLTYTTIRAPCGGVVSRRNVEAGQLVGPERPMMAIVPLENLWVVANFREDQLTVMRPGQRAVVQIDTFSGREFAGHVESIASASGSRFALLPPDNASGNFVKVVQRIPVLVRLDRRPDVVLRPGMSAEVIVQTR
jgi:membrane fusion protein (multidrug efflux system)